MGVQTMLTSLLAMFRQGLPVETVPMIWLGLIGSVVLLGFFFLMFLIKQYKRCPSNQILVVYGKVGTNKAAECLHGGGKFIIPLIQDYAYLGLEPLVIDIPLEGALSLNNIRVNVPATFTVGISTNLVLINAMNFSRSLLISSMDNVAMTNRSWPRMMS